MAESQSEILLYQTEDKKTKIEVRLQGETVWLNQSQMAELFQTSKQNVSLHIRNVFEEGELKEQAVVKEYLTTAADEKQYNTLHYNLDVAISVGYRVKSLRGTQFRIWATQRLREYLVKGFALDDERLAEGGTKNSYFDELLERVRAIRTSEKNFYRKVTDIYATAIDYDEHAAITREFFQTVQNKFHFAVTGHTAPEIVAQRANAKQPNMGLTSWKAGPGGPIRKADVTVAKNYLGADEMRALNLLVDQYLSFAEFQAQQRKPMHMKDWVHKLHGFLTLNERMILQDAGRVSREACDQIANKQFDLYQAKQREIEATNPVSDFDRAVKQIESKVIETKKPSPAPRPKPKK